MPCHLSVLFPLLDLCLNRSQALSELCMTFLSKIWGWGCEWPDFESFDKLISNLKVTATGIDRLFVELIKVCKDIIASPIALMINRSFREGVFISCRKIALITPIFKTGDKQVMIRYRVYRPVSVFVVLSILFERAYNNRLLSVLDANHIWNPKHALYNSLCKNYSNLQCNWRAR